MTALRNWYTTLLGILAAAATYLYNAGPNLPTTKQEWAALGWAAAIAGLGFVAKDATTGSQPK